ncbi:MAG TPA: cyclic nucleotide-binding domain-containing protein, partial [Jatrophihabitans sp.]|nr:cyclic nucleotide-binding domain-containing protein [Jatrophihabitans sp.]
MTTTFEADAVLRRAPLFHGVGADAVDALIDQMKWLDAPAGTVLFKQGDAGDFLYLVVSGSVNLTRRDGGRDRLVAVVGPGEHFGELSLLDPGPRTASARTADGTRLARLDKATLDGWMLERPEIALQMLRVVSRRLRRTRADLADLIFVDVPGRVARQVL